LGQSTPIAHGTQHKLVSHTEVLIKKGFRLAIDLENIEANIVDDTQLTSFKTLSDRITKALEEISSKK